jgi:hypothetical protein
MHCGWVKELMEKGYSIVGLVHIAITIYIERKNRLYFHWKISYIYIESRLYFHWKISLVSKQYTILSYTNMAMTSFCMLLHVNGKCHLQTPGVPSTWKSATEIFSWNHHNPPWSACVETRRTTTRKMRTLSDAHAKSEQLLLVE